MTYVFPIESATRAKARKAARAFLEGAGKGIATAAETFGFFNPKTVSDPQGRELPSRPSEFPAGAPFRATGPERVYGFTQAEPVRPGIPTRAEMQRSLDAVPASRQFLSAASDIAFLPPGAGLVTGGNAARVGTFLPKALEASDAIGVAGARVASQAAREAAPAVRQFARSEVGAVGKGAGKGKGFEPWENQLKNYALPVIGDDVNLPENPHPLSDKKYYAIHPLDQAKGVRIDALLASGDLRVLKKMAAAENITLEKARETGLYDKHALAYAIDHKRQVRQALQEGKPVPDEVLKDYPDLRPPAAESAPTPRSLEPTAGPTRETQGPISDDVYADTQAFLRAKAAADNAIRNRDDATLASLERSIEAITSRLEQQPGGMAYLERRLAELNRANKESVTELKKAREVAKSQPLPATPPKRADPAALKRIEEEIRALSQRSQEPPVIPSAPKVAQAAPEPKVSSIEPSPQPAAAQRAQAPAVQAVQQPSTSPPQGLPPSSAAGGGPPVEPPVPPTATGGVPPAAQSPKPKGQVGPPKTNPFGFRPVQTGLTKSQEIGNQIRSVVRLGGLNEEEVATPIMMERSRVRPVIDAKAARFGTLVDEQARTLFQPDKQGRIQALAGIDPQVPGAPTIQDIAARLPSYEKALTPEQAAFIREIGDEVQQYKAMLGEMGIDVPMPRADVMDGGYYLPRGKAEIEGADLPVKVRAGRPGAGAGKPGFLKAASFTSQAQGIEKGYDYPPLADALRSYVAQSGAKALDTYTTNLLKTATDASGDVIGRSPKMRLLDTKPQIVLAREQAAQAFKDTRSALQKAKKAAQGEELVTRVGREQASAESSAGMAAQVSQVQQGLRARRSGVRTQLEQAVTTAEADFKVAQRKYEQANQAYKAALDKETNLPRDEGSIGLSALQGYSFPDAMTNAVNKVLRSEGEPTGKAAGLLRGINTLNSWYRGVRATGDDSALMIQGLLAAGADQKAAAQAWKVNFKAWGRHGQDVLAKYIRDYDKTAASGQRLTSDQWIQRGLHLGGAETEFSLGQGATAGVGRMPLVRVANRAFGYTGDVLRLKWADDQLAAEINGLGPLRKPRTFQEIKASGDLDRIADAANKMTGWSPNRAAGDVGDILLFAPRFFQARLETVSKAALSLRPGGATLDRRMARKALLKTAAWGTLLTVTINEALGNETDFRPVVQNKQGQWQYNTNFMRIRWNGRDWSIFGPWDSLARIIVNTGLGVQNPKAAFQSWEAMLSGVVGIPLDVAQLFARGYGGEEVTALDLAKLFLEDLVPFGAGEIGAFGTQVAKGVAEGDAAEVAKGVGSEALTFGGTKSSPLTKEERGGGSASFTPSRPRSIKSGGDGIRQLGPPKGGNGLRRTGIKQLQPAGSR